MPLMKLRLARPALLVDIGRIGDLSYVRDDGDTIAIGALTRHHDARHDAGCCASTAPSLAHGAARSATRRCVTAARSAARSRTAIRPPTCRRSLLALDASSSRAARAASATIAAARVLPGLLRDGARARRDARRDPRPEADSAGWSYPKFNRRAQDWAIVAVAAVVARRTGRSAARRSRSRTWARPRFGRRRPRRRWSAERRSRTRPRSRLTGTEPAVGHAASSDFRRHLARVLTRRALEEAGAR